jgi:hypothetical protein
MVCRADHCAVCGRRPVAGYSINGYVITSEINPVGPSNPLNKTAAVAAGAWMANFSPIPRSGWCPVSVCSCR